MEQSGSQGELMATTIYKTGDDEYVVWGSVTESPTMWGTREQLIEFMVVEGIADLKKSIGERFDRADEHGTSSMIHSRVKAEMFQQKGTLMVSNLKAFVDSYDEGDGTYDESWIEPIDDPDFKDRRVGRAEQNGPWRIDVSGQPA